MPAPRSSRARSLWSAGDERPDGHIGDEQALVASVRAGDESAFEILFRAFYEPLCSFAATELRSRAAAEDVVQDLFGRLWERRAELVVRSSLATYLYSAVRHRVGNTRRHARVVQRLETALDREDRVLAMSRGPAAPDVQVRTDQLVQAIERVVALLPERCRVAYLLRWRHQLTDVEVAQVMGISVKGVEYQMARAIRTLRQELAHLL